MHTLWYQGHWSHVILDNTKSRAVSKTNPKRVQVMQAGQEEEVTQVGHCEQRYVNPGEESVASEIRS